MYKIALIYMIAGPCLLYFCLKLFGVAFRAWEPVAAYLPGVLCMFLFPRPIGEWMACPLALVLLRYLNNDEWNDIMYATSLSYIAVYPIARMLLPSTPV